MIKLKKLILLTLAVLVIYVSSWKSSEVNHNTKYSIEGCMHLGKKKNIIIGDFNIDYVENSMVDCFNPNFPSIKINSRTQHNAWLHVVHTNNDNWKIFIDSVDKLKYPLMYPFYSMKNNPYDEFNGTDNNFYDAPLWTYNLIKTKKMRWEGHAYPVKITDNQIMFFDGIAWGFELLPFKLHPKMITPRIITENELKSDLEILKVELTNHEFNIK